MAQTASDTRSSTTNQFQYRALTFTLILLAAFGFRSCAVLSQPETPIADAADYHQLAAALADGQGYVNAAGEQTAWRPPGYPAFLSLIYRVSGPSLRTATLIQAFIGALTVLMLMLFASTILSPTETVAAGAIAAIYPVLVALPRLLLSENLSLLLTLVTLWSVAMYLKSRRILWLALFGAVAGLNTLMRGGNLVLPILLGVGLLIVAFKRSTMNWKKTSAGLLLAFAMFVVVLMPWAARNYRVFHRFIPVATQEGLTLYGSYWPPSKNGRLVWGTLPGTEDPNIAAALALHDEVAASKYLEHVTLQRLREQPVYFFRLVPSKMISLLVPLDWEILTHPVGNGRSLNLGYLLIILPALFGFVLLWRAPQPNQWLLWIVPILVLFQAIVFYGSPRFRLPAELIAIILAAVGLVRAWAFLKKRAPLVG
jgi:4-amino-4-deoxy-L-arabinose transferase-like glycosyltransferase